MTIPTGADGFKNVYAAVLLAAAQGNAITIFFDESNSNCPITRVQVAT